MVTPSETFDGLTAHENTDAAAGCGGGLAAELCGLVDGGADVSVFTLLTGSSEGRTLKGSTAASRRLEGANVEIAASELKCLHRRELRVSQTGRTFAFVPAAPVVR